MASPVRTTYAVLKVGTGLICAYEAAAILKNSPQMPTVSMLCGRHKWLAPGILAGLAVHLYWRPLTRR